MGPSERTLFPILRQFLGCAQRFRSRLDMRLDGVGIAGAPDSANGVPEILYGLYREAAIYHRGPGSCQVLALLVREIVFLRAPCSISQYEANGRGRQTFHGALERRPSNQCAGFFVRAVPAPIHPAGQCIGITDRRVYCHRAGYPFPSRWHSAVNRHWRVPTNLFSNRRRRDVSEGGGSTWVGALGRSTPSFLRSRVLASCFSLPMPSRAPKKTGNLREEAIPQQVARKRFPRPPKASRDLALQTLVTTPYTRLAMRNARGGWNYFQLLPSKHSRKYSASSCNAAHSHSNEYGCCM